MSAAFELACTGLSDRGWDVRIVNIAATPLAARSRLPVLARAARAAQAIASAWRKTPTADVVYLTISQSARGHAKDVALLAPALSLGLPIVIHLHGGNFPEFYAGQAPLVKRVISGVFSRATRAIVLGASLADQFSMIPALQNRIRIVPNACATPIVRPRTPPRDAFRLLYLSNLIATKGYLDVIESARIFRSLAPETSLEIDLAGRLIPDSRTGATIASTQSHLMERIRDASQAATVVWHGPVSGEAKSALLSRAHALALPTYYPNEGQPIAILEALASGLPVIATRYRSIPDILPPEMDSLYVPPRDAAAIARATALLATDPAFYRQLSHAALRQATLFTPAAHIDRLSDVLSEAASGLSPAPDAIGIHADP